MKLYTLRFDVTAQDSSQIWDWEAEAITEALLIAAGTPVRRIMWWRPTNDRHAIQVRIRVRADSLEGAHLIADQTQAVAETLPDLNGYTLGAAVVEPWGESSGTH